MSIALRDQVHAYGTQLTDDQRPITDADVMALLDTVRELPTVVARERQQPRPWIAFAAAVVTIVLVGIIAVFASRTGSDSPPATHPPPVPTTEAATTTTVAEQASTTTTSTTTEAPADSAAGVGWEQQPFDSVLAVFEIDGVYFAFDSEQLADEASHYWWSVDGEVWQAQELPDVLGGPDRWFHWQNGGRDMVTVSSSGSPDMWVQFEVTVDIDAPDGDVLTLLQAPEESAPLEPKPSMVVPELDVEGLVPAGWAPFGSEFGGIPAEAAVGGITLIAGEINFELPDEVTARLPEFNEGGGGGDGGNLTTDYAMNGQPTHREIWTLQGSRISVEVVLLTGDEPETIHTGWVDIPDPLIPLAGHSMYREGTALHVLWLSEDGGATYTSIAPEPLSEGFIPPERSLVAHEGRFLYYVGYGHTTDVWSSVDGRTWTLETEIDGSFEVGSILRYEGVILTTSEFGLHRSSDGVEWVDVEGMGRGADLVLTDRGFLWLGREELRLSTGAITWQVIPVPEREQPFQQARIVGDVIVLGNWETGEVWTARMP